VLANLDRIGAYALLLAAVWALITGRLIPSGRLADHKELIALLREENGELRAAVKAGNDSQAATARQMEQVNQVLSRLVDDVEEPRRRNRAT
jgi:hypothetical protein